MGSRKLHPGPLVNAPGLVRIFGRFFPQGTGAVVNASNIAPAGWTVTRNGVGIFTVTLSDVWTELVNWSLGVQLATAGDLHPQLSTVNLAAKTINIRLVAAGVATDMAANANNSVGFSFIFRNTSLKR